MESIPYFFTEQLCDQRPSEIKGLSNTKQEIICGNVNFLYVSLNQLFLFYPELKPALATETFQSPLLPYNSYSLK